MLLLLLNGNKDIIIKNNNLDEDKIEVVKIDEKDLSRPRFIVKLINSKKTKYIYFGCIELGLQRFHTFMKIYIFFSNAVRGEIIDESGNKNKFSYVKLFLSELPLLLFESIASFFVVVYYYFKLPFMRWLFLREK